MKIETVEELRKRNVQLEKALLHIYSMFEKYGLCDEAKRACWNCAENVVDARNTAAEVLGLPLLELDDDE